VKTDCDKKTDKTSVDVTIRRVEWTLEKQRVLAYTTTSTTTTTGSGSSNDIVPLETKKVGGKREEGGERRARMMGGGFHRCVGTESV